MSKEISQETMDALAGVGAGQASPVPVDAGVAAAALAKARAEGTMKPDVMLMLLIAALENIDARLDALEAAAPGKAGT